MKETLITRKCTVRIIKDSDSAICGSLHIPCEDVKKSDCPLVAEYRIQKDTKEKED